MKKRLPYSIKIVSGILIFFISVLLAQDYKLQEHHSEKIIDGIYREIVLEDFETFSPGESDIRQFGPGKPIIEPRTDFPSPRPGSQKYLSWFIPFESADRLRLTWPSPLVINGYLREIKIWVQSTHLPGSLSLLVKDARGIVHLLNLGTLNFRGWQQLTIKTPDNIFQDDFYPGHNSQIEILALQYEPGPVSRKRKRQVFATDDLTAFVREKYILPAERMQ